MKDNFRLTPEQQTLVEQNLDLIRWTIFHYIDMDESVLGLGYDDLYQEGSIGLCRAAAAFNSNSTAKFRTFATTVIRNHLLDHCRAIQAERKYLPVTSLDACQGEPAPGALARDDTDALASELASAELLAYFKHKYRGVARLGVEALEYRALGYSGADIARMYHKKPNYIGACIARAAEKLRKEREVRDFYFTCVEKQCHQP